MNRRLLDKIECLTANLGHQMSALTIRADQFLTLKKILPVFDMNLEFIFLTGMRIRFYLWKC